MSDKQVTIPLKFFIVTYDLPSESRLNIRIDEIFQNVKVGEKDIRLVRGYFYNKLKHIRNTFYKILNKYTINVGFFRLLPFSQANDFIREVELYVKKELEKFERQLREFLLHGKKPQDISKYAKIDEEYTKLVIEYLKTQKIDIENRIKTVSIMDGFYIKLIPVILDLSQFEELDEKLKSDIERLRQEIVERTRRELEEKAREVLRKLVNKLEKLTILDVKSAREEIDQIMKMARDLNIESKLLNDIAQILVEPSRENIRKIKYELSSGRVKALLGLI